MDTRTKVALGSHGTFYITKATATDLEAIIAIYNQSIAGKQATANLTPVSLHERRKWFDDHLNTPTRPIYVVTTLVPMTAPSHTNDRHISQSNGIPKQADTTEQVVAWGSFSDLYARTAYHISSEVSIYLDQAYKGQGIGTALLTFMLTQAADLGIRNIVALVFAHNEPSLALFEKLGFERWGYLPQVCDMDGFLADVVMLGRAVDPNLA